MEGKRRWNWSAIIALVVVLSLLSVFVVRPTLVGYTVYRQIQNSNLSVEAFGNTIQGLTVELATTKANLSSYSTFQDQLLQEVRDAKREVISYAAEQEALDAKYNTFKASAEKLQDSLRQDLKETESQLMEKKDQLAELNQNTQELTAQLQAKSSELEEAVAERATCRGNQSVQESRYQELQQQFDALVRTMARSVCCKERVDTPSISAYAVLNNKIVCLESGENKLSC